MCFIDLGLWSALVLSLSMTACCPVCEPGADLMPLRRPLTELSAAANYLVNVEDVATEAELFSRLLLEQSNAMAAFPEQTYVLKARIAGGSVTLLVCDKQGRGLLEDVGCNGGTFDRALGLEEKPCAFTLDPALVCQ